MSAPVSTRYEILVQISVTKMRRVFKPSAFTAFTDGCSRFPVSTCTGIDIFSRVRGIPRGSNKGRNYASLLATWNGSDFVIASVDMDGG